MRAFRYLSILSAILLIAGEVYRSWGGDRPIVFVLDDFLAGGLLIAAALALHRQTFARRALFTGAWGIGLGMLYGSFFGKIFEPSNADPGNMSLGILTFLIGFAFVAAIIGFIASIMLPFRTDAS